jgi:nickel superoxide dismutase
VAGYLNTVGRFVAIKEEQAELAKRELLLLWTDYFKPAHLEAYPDLHEVFWNAAKACSECKQHVSTVATDQLMASVEKIHNMFWESKGREVTYFEAS